MLLIVPHLHRSPQDSFRLAMGLRCCRARELPPDTISHAQVNAATGAAKNLGKLPQELINTEDWTMASYNGKLYFMGGYTYSKSVKGLTKRVYVYDPSKNKWSRWSFL